MKTAYIGIDPGSASGCLTLYFDCVYTHYRFSKYTYHDIDSLLKRLKLIAYEFVVYMEDVHTFPGQGISSSGKFMHNKGVLEGILIANEIPYVKITPSAWMKILGMKKEKSETKIAYKKRLREKAETLIGQKLHAEEADSALLCYIVKNIK